MIAQAVNTACAAAVIGQTPVTATQHMATAPRPRPAVGHRVAQQRCVAQVHSSRWCSPRPAPSPRSSTPSTRTPGSRSTTPTRSVTPTPAHRSPMPKSPKLPTSLSVPLKTLLPHVARAPLVTDARYPDALFPVWRYHPYFTDTDDTGPCPGWCPRSGTSSLRQCVGRDHDRPCTRTKPSETTPRSAATRYTR